MRRTLVVSILAFALLAILWSCAKKSSPPVTAPVPDPACGLSATALSFGTVTIGSSADRTFTLTNTGGGTLSGTVTESSAEFAVMGSAGYSLGAGEAVTFTVRFSPASAGAKTCTLATGSTLCAAVTATGTGAAQPSSCDVSPASLDFGAVPLGQMLDRTFTISNTGSTQLTGTVTSPCADFSIPGQSSYDVAPGGSATLIVRFRPSTAGSQSCQVSVGSACGSLTCTGEGQEACVVTPRTLDFGQVRFHATADSAFTLRNASSGRLVGSIPSLNVLGFSLLGSGAYDLGPGQEARFTIRFAPTTSHTGPYGGTVGLGTLCGSLEVAGEGTFGCDCMLSTTQLDFGNVTVGETSPLRTFRISNSSERTITGPVRVLEGDFRAPATYDARPGIGQELWVEFVPSRAGPQIGKIVFDRYGCTGPGVPCDTLICTGTGVLASPPLCGVSTNTIDMGTVYFGSSKDTTLSLTNLGGGTLSGTVQFLDNSPPFSLVGPATYGLGAGQSQDFTIRFTSTGTPGHTYSYVGNLSAGSQCTAQGLGIQVTAVAREAPRPPACAISPTTLDFGTVAVGQSKDLTFDLENSGDGTLCGSVTENCPDFAITQISSYCITPPAFVRVTVRFSPSSTGFKQCTVSPGAGCPALTVRGTGS
jgi:hypothetical protein